MRSSGTHNAEYGSRKARGRRHCSDTAQPTAQPIVVYSLCVAIKPPILQGGGGGMKSVGRMRQVPAPCRLWHLIANARDSPRTFLSRRHRSNLLSFHLVPRLISVGRQTSEGPMIPLSRQVINASLHRQPVPTPLLTMRLHLEEEGKDERRHTQCASTPVLGRPGESSQRRFDTM